MENTYNIEVGKRIFKARKDAGMTRAELGKLVKLHESTIKRYEDGQIKALDIDKVKDFAKALSVEATYILGWDNKQEYHHLTIAAHNDNLEEWTEFELKKIEEYKELLIKARDKDKK